MLFVDEIDKGLAGAAASGATDSGVSARMFGDAAHLAGRPHQRRVRRGHGQRRSTGCRRSSPGPSGSTACSSSTCRAATEKDAIWQIHRRRFGIDDQRARPDDAAVDRRRDRRLLPAGGAAGRAAHRGGPERRAGGAVSAAESLERLAAVGQRPLPGGRSRRASIASERPPPARRRGVRLAPRGNSTPSDTLERMSCHAPIRRVICATDRSMALVDAVAAMPCIWTIARTSSGRSAWNPDKDWCGADALMELLAALLSQHGLSAGECLPFTPFNPRRVS